LSRGVVTSFDPVTGHGYIKGADERLYFFTVPLVSDDETPALTIDEVVDFDSGGPVFGRPRFCQATRVRRVYGAGIRRKLADNPFNAQGPVMDPARFAGRSHQLKLAIEALFNRRNLLLTGSRGVGKTSIALQLQGVMQGDSILIDRLGFDSSGYTFNHATALFECSQSTTVAKVVRSVCKGLHHQYLADERAIRRRKTSVEVSLDRLKLKAEGETEFDTAGDDRNTSDDLVDLVASIITSGPNGVNGVAVVIDDIDALVAEGADYAEFAHFFKRVTENIHGRGFLDFVFIIAGVTGSVTHFITRNPSFARTFQEIDVPRMSLAESKEIVDRALDATGPSSVRADVLSVSEAARDEIAAIAEGLPSVVQLVGSRAFARSDRRIEVENVRDAIDHIINVEKVGQFEQLLETIRSRRVWKQVVALVAREGAIEFDTLVSQTGCTGEDIRMLTVEEVVKGQMIRGPIFSRQTELVGFFDPLFRKYCQSRLL
jgi:hypothetical protein